MALEQERNGLLVYRTYDSQKHTRDGSVPAHPPRTARILNREIFPAIIKLTEKSGTEKVSLPL
jgi:hypothetical protein